MFRARVFAASLILAVVLHPTAHSAQTVAPSDPEEFSRFIEEQFRAPLRKRKVGGAVLVAVRDGQEFYRAAYGYRDVEQQLRVDADHTMFVIASISKTFTATAVAQLKSQGLLDYDDTVGRRLTSLRIDSRYANQLKIRHLITHTTGIPDLFLGASCRSRRDCLPLSQFLAERQPEAHAPPGSFVSYSNFSNALAGQVVEDVSGRSYGDYLREHIFRPLGMRNTRYDVPGQPTADDATASQAFNYEIDGDRLVRSPENYSMFYPAGQIAASGADMERYMIGHLEGGPFLADAERLDMQRTHAHTPGFRDGYGWGWNCRTVGNVAVIGHGGDLRGVVSDLLLVPQSRFGYFVAVTGDAGPVLEDLAQAFKDRYLLPRVITTATKPATAVRAEVPDDLQGVYQDFRFTHDDPLQLLSTLSETRIRRTDDQEVSVDLPMLVGGGTYRLLASGKDEFHVIAAPEGRPITADSKLRVMRDGQGAVRYFAFEDRGYDLTAEKVPVWRQTRFKLPAIALLLLGHVIAALFAVVVLVRRLRNPNKWVHDALALCAIAVSMLSAVVFPVSVGTVLASASKWDLLYGLQALGLKPAYALLPLAGASLIAAAVLFVLSKDWSRRLRKAYPIAILLGAAYLALLSLNGQFNHVY